MNWVRDFDGLYNDGSPGMVGQTKIHLRAYDLLIELPDGGEVTWPYHHLTSVLPLQNGSVTQISAKSHPQARLLVRDYIFASELQILAPQLTKRAYFYKKVLPFAFLGSIVLIAASLTLYSQSCSQEKTEGVPSICLALR